MKDKLIRSTKDLRSELAVLFENVKKGHVKATDAKQLANIAGKMINSAKLDLEYECFKQKYDNLKIDFLE